MTTLTLKTTQQQDALIAHYLKAHKVSLEDLVTEILLEKLEDEADLQALQKAQAEDDGTRYTHQEMLEKLGLTQEDLDNATLPA